MLSSVYFDCMRTLLNASIGNDVLAALSDVKMRLGSRRQPPASCQVQGEGSTPLGDFSYTESIRVGIETEGKGCNSPVASFV